MEFEWKLVEIVLLNRNNLRLREDPIHTQLGGLKIEFLPSKSWCRKNPHLEPKMVADLIAGREIYKLPKYFRQSTIRKVFALLPTKDISLR